MEITPFVATASFVIIVDGDVVLPLMMNESPQGEMLTAALRSNPIIVEVPSDHPNLQTIGTGWKYDGTTFFPDPNAPAGPVVPLT
jgi:hypothetical protein